jgi:cytochrome c oxidase subunit 1
MPSSSIWPFVSALATTILFVGSIFTPWAVVWAAAPVAIAATLWFWPKRAIVQERVRSEARP